MQLDTAAANVVIGKIAGAIDQVSIEDSRASYNKLSPAQNELYLTQGP